MHTPTHAVPALHFQCHTDSYVPLTCNFALRTKCVLKFLGFRWKKYSLKLQVDGCGIPIYFKYRLKSGKWMGEKFSAGKKTYYAIAKF